MSFWMLNAGSPIVNPSTGQPTPEFYKYLANLFNAVGQGQYSFNDILTETASISEDGDVLYQSAIKNAVLAGVESPIDDPLPQLDLATWLADALADPVDAGAFGGHIITDVLPGTGIAVSTVAFKATVSLAQTTNNEILANISGATAAPLPNSMTAILDSTMGSARGDTLYRGASNWAASVLGASGYVWQSNGTDALWGPVSASSLAPIVDATILSNISGGSAAPAANTLTAILDHDMGAVRGEMLYRGASNWAALGLGSNGQIIGSNGTDLLWENLSYGMLPNIADSTFLANISGGSATPSATTETAFLDHAIGSARGDILYRGASNWAALLLGSTGQMLRSNGTDVTWASVIGYAGDQSYQTANWAPGTNFSTNSSFYTSATTQQAAEREILAGVFLISTLGGNQASSPQRDKVALSGMIEGQAGSGDTWALYGVNIIDAGSMASTGYTAHTVELDLNNRSTVDLSSPITIGGHTAQAFGASITGSSVKPCTAGLWITGTGAAGGPGSAQWDKGIWFTGSTSIGTACIVDASQNAYYCLDVSAAVYQKSPVNWNTGATAVSATTGAATLPTNPAGFLLLHNGGTPIKVPYYNN